MISFFLSDAAVVEITKAFNTSRESLPSMCICTPVDVESPSFWTQNNPNRTILNRLRVISQQALSILDKKLTQPKQQNDFKVSLIVVNLPGKFIASKFIIW